MEKLIEMQNADVSISLFGGKEYSYKNEWAVTAKRNSDGINLEIRTSGPDLAGCIDDLYEKWLSATRGLPQHSLKQIEYMPPAPLDDEIPF